jgi:hypothetical protein
MAETKITCPECGKVLRPAKPLPAGKRVKCPQCSALFVPGEEAEASAAVSKTPAQNQGKGASKPAAKAKPAKKTADDKPSKPKPAPRPSDDDDDEGGPRTYEFIDDHRKQDEPEIDYVPDTSIKDLRGPAQEAIMGPSNWIIRLGVGGCVCYFILLVIITLPVIFPTPKPTNADGTPVVATPDEKDKDKEKTHSMFVMYGWDLAELQPWEVVVLVIGCICGMTYCGIVTYGGVKMQTLESRVWGLVASILVIVPVNSVGYFGVMSIICTFFWMLFFDPDGVYYIIVVPGFGAFVPNILSGIRGLVTLLRPDVIDGYEYVPEDARTERRRRG